MKCEMWGEGKTWKTKSAFLSWIRGGIRRSLWNRSPIKINFINKHRIRIKNPNPRGKVAQVWGAKCSQCKKNFPIAQVDVDHKVGNHSLLEIEDIQKFVEGIVLVSEDDLQFCCKECHKAKTHAEKQGISFEAAVIEKEVIAIIKAKKDKEVLLKCNIVPASNQKQRREQLIELFTREIQ